VLAHPEMVVLEPVLAQTIAAPVVVVRSKA
jgi:hypothetical protein